MFAHASGNIEDDALSEKGSRIREIKLAGFEVAHVIHRHGMDEKTAFEVEAALIDAYPGITNVMDGHGNGDFGAMHSREIIQRYSAQTAEFDHKALLISINRSALNSSVYEATRFAWRLSLKKAQQAELILATVQGMIVGVYVADHWLSASGEHFPGRETIEGRYGFVGHEAPAEFQSRYLGKRIPDSFRKRGASNPIKYTW